MRSEILLGTVYEPGCDERLSLWRFSTANGGVELLLRMESFAPGIGWFVQSSVPMKPGQVQAVMSVLGMFQKCESRSASDDGPVILPFPQRR